MPVTTGRKIQVLAREPRSARRQPHIARDFPAVPIERVGGVNETAAPTTHQRRLTLTRRAAVTVWALVVVYRTLTDGLAFNRELLLLYIATGLVAASGPMGLPSEAAQATALRSVRFMQRKTLTLLHAPQKGYTLALPSVPDSGSSTNAETRADRSNGRGHHEGLVGPSDRPLSTGLWISPC